MQLIGVLITLLVISIASVFLYTHFSSPTGLSNQTPHQVVDTASDSAIKSDILNLQSVLEQYRVMKGNYPSTLQDLVAEKMLSAVPQNPKTHLNYQYESDGKSYSISTTLSDGGTFTRP